MHPKVLALTILLSTATGCGTLFFHNPQTVRVTANVPGALVIAKDEAILGRLNGLSGEFPLDRKNNHTLLVSAHGNEAATVTVESHYSWWRMAISLTGDIFLGFIPLPPILWGVVAILPDMGSGAWKVLDDDVAVTLRPRAEPDPATAPPPPSVLGITGRCPTCNASHEREAMYCPQCGVGLEARHALRPCAICGEPRPPASVTCPHCGLK